MGQIKPVFARSHKANSRACLAPFTLIHPVCAAERLCSEPFVVNHPRLLQLRGIHQPNIQPTVRHIKCGFYKLHSVRISINNRRNLNCVFHGFQANPNARES